MDRAIKTERATRGERYWGNRAIERYRQRERQRDGEREVGHCCEDIYLSIYIYINIYSIEREDVGEEGRFEILQEIRRKN